MGKTNVICIWLVVFVNRVEDSTIPVEQLVRILMTFQRLSKGKEYSCHYFALCRVKNNWLSKKVRVLKSLYVRNMFRARNSFQFPDLKTKMGGS